MTHADEALKCRPDSVRALRLKGISRHKAAVAAPRESAQRLFEESFGYFAAGNKLHPEDYFLLTDWAFALLAQARRREGADAGQPLDLAEQKSLEALKLESGYPCSHVALGDVSRQRAQLAPEQAHSHLEAAHGFYQAALKIEPDLESALTGSAIVATRLSELSPKEKYRERLAEAEQRLRRALELRGDNESALEALGDVLSSQGQLFGARKAYNQVCKIDPQREHSQLRVAEMDLESAQSREDPKLMTNTIEAFRAAARAFPERARAHSGLGEALAQSAISNLSTGDPVRQLEESIAEFQHAASLDRRNVTIHRRWRRAVDELAKRQPPKRDEHLKEVARLDDIIASLTAPQSA